MTTASDADFKLLFTEARTHSAFLPKPPRARELCRAVEDVLAGTHGGIECN